jgi:undecaprenyl-diphosphatase
MTAFTVYGALSNLVPGTGPVILPTAALIGLSRVFLGVHYPTDVLVGCLLGLGIGSGAAWLLGPVLP